jgi:4-alpha-glucanotransferase
MAGVYHTLGFLMHQPPDIFSLLAENQMGKLLQIINSYQMPLKYLDTYRDSLKIHVGFSGILLEQLLNKEVIDACRKIIDIPLMLNGYRESKNVEIIGMGYSHPIFPMIPALDWDCQVLQGREIIREVFGQEPKGFWPAEAGFCLDMIPVLRKNGYEYIILDRSFLKPKGKEGVRPSHRKDRYSSIGSMAHYGIEIGAVVISKNFDYPRKTESLREIFASNPYRGGPYGQRKPLIVDWLFIDNLICRKINNLPEDPEFWEEYFSPYLERIYKAEIGVRSVFLKELMHDWKVRHLIAAQMDTCADDSQSEGHLPSDDGCAVPDRRRVIEDVWQFSQQYHEVKSALLRRGDRSLCQEYLTDLLEKAQKWLLRSQTGCYFSEDGPKVARIYENIKPGLILLKEVKRQVS